MKTLFERMGGLSATRALADEFYDVMENKEGVVELLRIHPEKLFRTRLNLYRYLTHWFGGPELFGKQYMNANWLELKHRRLNFNENEKNQWLYCMNTAMNNLNFNSELKWEIMTLFRDMIDSMQAIKKDTDR